MLLISVGALALGPALFSIMRRARAASSLLTGFVLVSVLGLVLLHILPEAVHEVGAWAALPVGVGLILPGLLERKVALGTARARSATLLLAVLGLFVHGLIDGMALSGGRLHIAASLAVIVHRLPASLLIWSIAAPRYGARVAWAVLASLGLATIIGFSVGQQAFSAGPTAVGWFQALLGGLLLHVISDHLPSDGHRGRREISWELVGGLLAVGLLLWVPETEAEHHGLSLYGARLLDLALESAPALLLGYALAGVVAELLPRASFDWMRAGGGLSQAARGVVFGLPVPICSCGVVPLYQSLIRRGAPPAAAMAFLVATPELGVESMLLSVPLLGWNFAIARVIAAALVAIAVGWWVGRALAPAAAAPEVEEAPRERIVWRALSHGFVDVVDMTGAWIVVGLLVAAAMSPEQLSGIAALPAWLQVPLFALVGMPLYVCASGATPLAAGLIFAGVSPGAALAFLLAGPATNVTTFGVLRGLHGRKVAIRFGLGVIGVAVALGWIVNLISGGWPAPPAETGAHEAPSLLQLLSFAVVGAALLASLLRKGPHAWIMSLGSGTGHTHGSDCSDGCGSHGHSAGTCCGGSGGCGSHGHSVGTCCGGSGGCESHAHPAEDTDESDPHHHHGAGCCGG